MFHGRMRERPLIIAHRGACKYAPENTLEAIAKAIELQVDGIEIDVHLSRDKVPVVIHSGELAAFTTTYDFVHRTPLRALKAIDVGSHFGASFRNASIPTLEEALTLLAPSPLLINLELKSQPYWHFGLEDRVVAVVRALGLGHRVVFSSFSPWLLIRLRYLAPEIPRGLIIAPRAFPFLQARFFDTFTKIANVHCFEGALTPELMGQFRTQGWRIMAWTVNTPSECERMLHLGVDGIITDDPLLVRNVIRDTHGL